MTDRELMQQEPRVEFYTEDPAQFHSLSIAEAARVLAGFFQEFPGGLEEMQAMVKRLTQPWETFCDTHCTAFDHHPNCKLAQPVQEPVATLIKRGSKHTYMSECVSKLTDGTYNLYTAPPRQEQPVQEPVAWYDPEVMNEDRGISWTPGQFHTAPLYTAPQPRQWQGLTDEERGQVYASWRFNGSNSSNLELCRAIEAKLREKNQKENPGVL